MTSHEFIVAQKDNHAPLILSEFTGTAHSFGSALLVNPWDYHGVSNTLNEALRMSQAEKKARHEQLLEHVCSNSADFWARSFLEDLKASLLIPDQANPTPPLDIGLACSLYKRASRRMIFLDYDVSFFCFDCLTVDSPPLM